MVLLLYEPMRDDPAETPPPTLPLPSGGMGGKRSNAPISSSLPLVLTMFSSSAQRVSSALRRAWSSIVCAFARSREAAADSRFLKRRSSARLSWLSPMRWDTVRSMSSPETVESVRAFFTTRPVFNV